MRAERTWFVTTIECTPRAPVEGWNGSPGGMVVQEQGWRKDRWLTSERCIVRMFIVYVQVLPFSAKQGF